MWMNFLNLNNWWWYKLIIVDNCLRDHEYTPEQQEWIQTHTYYYPQHDCAHTDISITKTTTQGLVDTGSVINYDIAYYNSWSEAFNVTVYENPWTWLTITDASEAYTTLSNEEYGVPWDLCYDQLYNNNTWYYLELLDAWIVDDRWVASLEEYITDRYGYGWSDRWAYFIDNIELNEGYESFQALMFWYELDMTANPDCGYVDWPLVYTYVFSIWDILANTWGLISVVWYIADYIDISQNFIQNTVTIQADNPETDYDNNTSTTTNYFTFSPPVYGCTDPEALNYNAEADEDDWLCEYASHEEDESETIQWWGWWVTLDPDNCPDGDLSGSYYDGTCEETVTEDDSQSIDTWSNHPSAPVVYNACDVYNEKASPHTFTDIQGTSYEWAIELLIENCLVHGYYNQWIEYGSDNGLKRWELYKVFTRLSWLPRQKIADPLHWSDKYFQAWNEAGLWDGIDITKSPESVVSKKELLQVAINYMKTQWYTVQLPENYILKEGIVARWAFASFVEQIILYNTTQENQSQESNDTNQTALPIKIEEESTSKETSVIGKTYDSNPEKALHSR